MVSMITNHVLLDGESACELVSWLCLTMVGGEDWSMLLKDGDGDSQE